MVLLPSLLAHWQQREVLRRVAPLVAPQAPPPAGRAFFSRVVEGLWHTLSWAGLHQPKGVSQGRVQRCLGSQVGHSGAAKEHNAMFFHNPHIPFLVARWSCAIGERQHWTHALDEGHPGASLQARTGRSTLKDVEQPAQEDREDGDLDFYILQRATWFGYREGEATGLLVTEAPASFWAGTLLSRGAARRAGWRILLAVVVLCAVFSCRSASGSNVPAQATYTMVQALTARTVLQTLGQSITIGGDGPYTIQLWPHAGEVHYQLTQTIRFGRGTSFFQGTPDGDSFAGMLSNAQGEHLPMLLDLAWRGATQATAALATQLVEHPQTPVATTATTVTGIIVQVSQVSLHTPPAVTTEEPSAQARHPHTLELTPVLPYHDQDYVFWLRLPDRSVGRASDTRSSPADPSFAHLTLPSQGEAALTAGAAPRSAPSEKVGVSRDAMQAGVGYRRLQLAP